MKSKIKIYGESPPIEASLRIATLIAATDVTTLIIGDTGTGKELFARYIHQHSPRSEKAFHVINCAALTAKQIESNLFEHTAKQKNANTQNQGGSLFLDEVAELPLKAQSQLLGFLEKDQIDSHDLRILAASNKNLLEEVDAGNFRKDLFYRLNIVPLELPSLKDRLDDVLLLIELFFQELVKEHKLTPPSFSPSALAYLKQYTWPGNVRELRNFCERMLILFSGKIIDVSNLPHEICTQKKISNKFSFSLPSQGIRLEELEIDLYEQAIQSAHGNKSAAARLLGLSRDAFLYRLKKYNLG